MKLPRDLSGADLAKLLAVRGYRISGQTGSRIRPTIDLPSRHHVTVPAHDPLKVGSLAGILGDVALHARMSRDELVRELFG